MAPGNRSPVAAARGGPRDGGHSSRRFRPGPTTIQECRRKRPTGNVFNLKWRQPLQPTSGADAENRFARFERRSRLSASALDCPPPKTPMNANSRKRMLASIVCGVLLTAGLTATAYVVDSRTWACTFVWQACLVQTVIHTPDNSIHEGSPIDVFAFAFGVSLGVPLYSVASYLALRRLDASSTQR